MHARAHDQEFVRRVGPAVRIGAGREAKRTRPYRPQTNGIERYHRTLTDEWVYARPYPTDTTRAAALATWLHSYSHHRSHTAIGGPPATLRPTSPGRTPRVCL